MMESSWRLPWSLLNSDINIQNNVLMIFRSFIVDFKICVIRTNPSDFCRSHLPNLLLGSMPPAAVIEGYFAVEAWIDAAREYNGYCEARDRDGYADAQDRDRD